MPFFFFKSKNHRPSENREPYSSFQGAGDKRIFMFPFITCHSYTPWARKMEVWSPPKPLKRERLQPYREVDPSSCSIVSVSPCQSCGCCGLRRGCPQLELFWGGLSYGWLSGAYGAVNLMEINTRFSILLFSSTKFVAHHHTRFPHHSALFPAYHNNFLLE